ncbi:MAG TPA: hypothetical protein VKH42_14750 [Vicinamibacterales bacterium]|nr:hypothetical protein [Vicinamibacterales bacterium]
MIRHALALAATFAAVPLLAQESKPVPKDSARVAVVGCTKGYIFTAAERTTEAPGSFDLPEGTHLRINGPKKLINEIKAHEGSMIELTGLMKKGQIMPGGVRIGGSGVSVGAPTSPGSGQAFIDVEGWRQVVGRNCPAR